MTGSLSADDRAAAWRIADEAVTAYLERRRPDVAGILADAPPDSPLRRPGRAFVTIRRHGRLLGCIGTLEADRPLAEDIADNAVAAASRDPRFAPVTPTQYADADLEVSVLTCPAPLEVRSLAELLGALRPGVDGLVIDDGVHRATFLPAVWTELADPRAFCDHLWRKAGLLPGTWPPGLRVSRYEAVEISGPDGS